MRFTCFIDTSSYINLTLFEFNRGTLLKLFSELATIKFCPFINSTEIPNHFNDKMPTTEIRSSNVIRPSRFSMNEYHKRIFDNESTTNDNRGEKENLIILIDYYFNKKAKGIIYLIDDDKALNGFLSGIIHAFPFKAIWNSFDVILYLYIDHKEFTKELAISAISDLDAKLATNNIKMSPEKTQKRIQKRQRYINYIELISKVKSR